SKLLAVRGAAAEAERAAGIGDGDRAPMAAFHQAAANDFDENRVVHCSSGLMAERAPSTILRWASRRGENGVLISDDREGTVTAGGRHDVGASAMRINA